MKTISKSKKKSSNKSGVVHIDSNVHKKLKIYCATHDEDLGKYTSRILEQSLKNFKINNFNDASDE